MGLKKNTATRVKFMTNDHKDKISEIGALQDREAIREAVYAIASGVDRFDPGLLAENVWDDAKLDMGGEKIIGGRDFVNALKPPSTPPKGRMHVVTNVRINLDGDIARTESMIISCQQLDGEQGWTTRIRAGRYLDKFEKRSGSWKLAERTMIDEWAREDPVNQTPATGKHQGAPSTDDLNRLLFYGNDK